MDMEQCSWSSVVAIEIWHMTAVSWSLMGNSKKVTVFGKSEDESVEQRSLTIQGGSCEDPVVLISYRGR